ncbi:MAG TPA: DUF2752 domain-containing protein [Sandaracinaceae bacterium LLY-WYZ-13_1]|nr:DUF2752 domain-containing protein [Sandaracinaceae bacterium LLY-WYZ-13_1]
MSTPSGNEATPVASPVSDRSVAGVGASVPADAGADGAGEVERPRFSWTKLLGTLAPLGFLGALMAFDVPVCPSKNLLGVPCPGCGLTRATEAMVTGDFVAMLRFHPMAPLLAPAVLFSLVRVTLVSAGAVRTRRDPLGKLPNWFWGSVAAVLVGLWVARIAGFLGGHPDSVDFTHGFLYRGGDFLVRSIALLL